jgi:hypothetical protein
MLLTEKLVCRSPPSWQPSYPSLNPSPLLGTAVPTGHSLRNPLSTRCQGILPYLYCWFLSPIHRQVVVDSVSLMHSGLLVPCLLFTGRCELLDHMSIAYRSMFNAQCFLFTGGCWFCTPIYRQVVVGSVPLNIVGVWCHTRQMVLCFLVIYHTKVCVLYGQMVFDSMPFSNTVRQAV